MLIFLRHGKLDLPYPSHDQMPYQLIVDIANRTIDPPLDLIDATERLESLKGSLGLQNIKQIFTSSFQRARDSGELMAKKIELLSGTQPAVQTLELLDEMRMNLLPIYPHDLDKPIDLKDLMRHIFEESLHGSHVESVAEMADRARRLFEYLKNENGTILCVTHDNFMRVIELYIRSQGTLEPATITIENLQQTQKNDYLRGFKTDTACTFFNPI